MKHILSILIVLIILFAFSCRYDDPVKEDGGDNNPDTNTTKENYHDFYSMRVGTEWEYTYIFENIKYDNVISKVKSVSIIGTDSIFNLYAYKDSSYYNGPVNYVKRTNGLYVKTLNDDTLSLWFKYPANINDEYIFNTFNTTVKSNDTLISVPYGKFKCIHYILEYYYPSGDIYQYNYFVSKRIGLVGCTGFHYYAQEDRYILTYESNLVNYKY